MYICSSCSHSPVQSNSKIYLNQLFKHISRSRSWITSAGVPAPLYLLYVGLKSPMQH